MKIDPATLAFDIDGVVADTMSLFLEIALKDFGIRGAYEDITEYDLRNCLGIDDSAMWEIIYRILQGDYAHTLNPMPDAPRVLKCISNQHRPTLFVTARPDAAHIRDWICTVLEVPSDFVHVIATGSFEQKVDVLLENRISHFVEDRLETCFLIAEAGIRPIVFKHPWNRKPHPFTEVENWLEIESMILMK